MPMLMSIGLLLRRFREGGYCETRPLGNKASRVPTEGAVNERAWAQNAWAQKRAARESGPFGPRGRSGVESTANLTRWTHPGCDPSATVERKTPVTNTRPPTAAPIPGRAVTATLDDLV